MSLYRTHRPHTFKDVIGQEHITGVLQSAIKDGKVGHAYLFSGGRGLGKTSVARILAREVKCVDTDLYEIDAASNNSVDDIRELTENVYTLPFSSPYKVYILDEAHMLSKGAWNAFLKTLEEPPAHAIFILATTELDKVPDTVRSRCQTFEFKKPTRAILQKYVSTIAKKEGLALDASASDLIAILANGSYRDSLSILERVQSLSKDKTLSRKEVEEATGAPESELLVALLKALHEGSSEKALAVLNRADKNDTDMTLFLALFCDMLRSVLLIRHAKELRTGIEEELGELYATLETIALEADSKITHETLKVMLDATARAKFLPEPVLALELAVYELTKSQ